MTTNGNTHQNNGQKHVVFSTATPPRINTSVNFEKKKKKAKARAKARQQCQPSLRVVVQYHQAPSIIVIQDRAVRYSTSSQPAITPAITPGRPPRPLANAALPHAGRAQSPGCRRHHLGLRPEARCAVTLLRTTMPQRHSKEVLHITSRPITD